MALPCVAMPTLTTAQVSTSQSLVTTTTESISTAPGSVSTVVLSTCAQLGSSSQCQPAITTSFITLPGSTTTVDVPATLTVDVPVTVLTTLFGSSCSSSSISSTDSSTSSKTTSRSSSSSSSASASASLTSPRSSTTPAPVVVTTPPPLVLTTNSLVTADGSTFLSLFTSTSTYSATTLQAQSTAGSSERKVATGPVVGGVVGGFALLLLLGLLTWRVVKRQSKSDFDQFFNSDEDIRYGPRHTDRLIENPSYQYGMVGKPSSNPVSLEPLSLPPAVPNAFGSGGSGQGQGLSQSTAGGQFAVANDGGLGQAIGQVGGQASGQVSGQASGPLANVGGLPQASGPPGALGTGGSLGQAVTGGHGVVGNLLPIAHTGNPSVVPLIAGVGNAAATSGAYAAATSARPSSSRSTESSSQALGPLVTPAKSQGGYPPGLQSWSHGYGQGHAGPSSPGKKRTNGPGPSKLSLSSTTSVPSAYSHTSYNTSDNNGSVSSVLPSMGAGSQQQQQQHRRTSFGPQATNSNQHYGEIGSSSSSSSMGGAAGSSSQEAPVYDEQGRPLNMPPEKAPLVHLDGALYQQPSRGDSTRRSGNAPPAYIE